MTQLTITQARRGLLNLPERLARAPERAVTITRRGRPVLAVMPWEFYESLVETLNVLSDSEMLLALRQSLDDLKHERLVSNAEAKKRLGR
jgi:prevent-host-death family protein